MSKKKSIALGIVILLIGQVAVFAESYSYFHIKDLAHGAYLVAGFKYDEALYHLKVDKGELPQTAQWRFEKAGKFNGKEYYYLVDRLHSSGIMGGDNYDGDTYSQKNYKGKQNAMWTATEKTLEQGQIPVIFTDRKHKFDLVAGSSHDGEIYHQSAGERSNALWVLELVVKGDQGPDFYVAEQRLINLEYHYNLAKVLNQQPALTIKAQRVPNDTEVTQTFSITKSDSQTVEEFWSFKRAVKASIFQTLSVSGGFAGTGEVKSETTIGFTYEQEWVNSNKRTVKNDFTWNIPVVVPPHSVVEVNGILMRLNKDIPFTATIENTLGSGERKIITVDGMWEGVEYVTGEVSFKQTKL